MDRRRASPRVGWSGVAGKGERLGMLVGAT
jgi:hypothetical protein